jgi:hypothetical protein
LPLAFADQLQAADHRAHLVVQERAGRRLDDDLVGIARHIQPIERTQRRIGLALGGAEGREIMAADERLRRRVHERRVKVSGQPPHPVTLERRRRSAREYSIAVVPRRSAVARVEVVGSQRAIDHRDRRRTQMEVQRLAHAKRLPRLVEVEVRHLSQRVHAGIGAAGAAHAARLA